jgi:hypothetical protein
MYPTTAHGWLQKTAQTPKPMNYTQALAKASSQTNELHTTISQG